MTSDSKDSGKRFRARFSEEFARDFNALDKPVRDVADKIIKKILAAPQRGKRMTGPLAGSLRERFLVYRIIYKINESDGFVEFVKLKKRDTAYK